ncbi:MAG: hypothetical protein B6I19_00375 [Bacteroidetes bacterium 4572_114]|nr:MAG: hypothetical protein B6I19_00375 [Bacteroidetes bacterium 4572_114]
MEPGIKSFNKWCVKNLISQKMYSATYQDITIFTKKPKPDLTPHLLGLNYRYCTFFILDRKI